MAPKLKLQCCICKQGLDYKPSAPDSLDPCALELIAHVDRDWSDQKSQTFYCHFECFRRLIGDNTLLYIAEPDYSTHGEFQAEVSDEGAEDEEPT